MLVSLPSIKHILKKFPSGQGDGSVSKAPHEQDNLCLNLKKPHRNLGVTRSTYKSVLGSWEWSRYRWIPEHTDCSLALSMSLRFSERSLSQNIRGGRQAIEERHLLSISGPLCIQHTFTFTGDMFMLMCIH